MLVILSVLLLEKSSKSIVTCDLLYNVAKDLNDLFDYNPDNEGEADG